MNSNPSPNARRNAIKLGAAAWASLAFGRAWSQPVNTAVSQPAPLPAQARIIVGFAPGGAPDTVARRLADLLAGKLAGAVIVENKPGAGSRIALDAARQQAPDGLTLLLSPAGIVATNPHTFKKLNYDPFSDLTPVALTNTVSFGFAVGPAVPATVRDLASFATWAKAQATPVAFGSPAAGAPPHFIGDHLGRKLGLNLTHVPYRGSAPAFNDLFGGNIAAVSLTLGDLVKHHESSKLRVIAVTGARRSEFMPSIATFGDQGVAGLERDDWFGLYIAGKATPDVVRRLSALTREAQSGKPYQDAMRASYLEPAWSTPDELFDRGRADHAHWGPIIKASGFVAEG